MATPDIDARIGLTYGIKAVAAALNPEDAQAAFDSLIEVLLQHSSDGGLADALKAVPGMMGAEQTQRVFDSLIRTLQSTSGEIDQLSLAISIIAIPGMNHKQAQEVLDFLIQGFRKTGVNKYMFAQSIREVVKSINPDQVQRALDFIIQELQQTTDTGAQGVLAEAIKGIARAINPDQAPAAFETLSRAFRETNDTNALNAFSEAMMAVRGKATPEMLLMIIKLPQCRGPAQQRLVDLMEQYAGGKKFNGNVWEMVTWARTARDSTGKPFELRVATD